jgi:hypothetical protein
MHLPSRAFTENANKIDLNKDLRREAKMSEVASKAIERLPLSLFVFPIVSGLFLLFLSPIRFLLPSWIVEPFNLKLTDILGSFLIIFICSFGLGVLAYIVSPLLMGDGGLNDRIGTKLDWKRSSIESIKFSPTENVSFGKWVRKNQLTTIFNLFSFQFDIVSGVLCGCEIALLLYLFGSVTLFFPSTWTWLSSNLYLIVVLLVVLLIAAILSWAYDRFYFRDYITTKRNEIYQIFIESTRPSAKCPKCNED